MKQPGAAPARRLARKTYSFQLPLQLAARFEALCELYPERPPAELLADLLGLGLAQLEQHWPRAVASGLPAGRRPAVYLLTGPFDEFRGLVLKHHTAMERERAGDAPEPLQPLDAYQLGDAD